MKLSVALCTYNGKKYIEKHYQEENNEQKKNKQKDLSKHMKRPAMNTWYKLCKFVCFI